MAGDQDGRALPSKDEVHGWLTEDNNWGRWGADDEAGAVNLIDAAKRVEALSLARTGRVVSVSRPYPVEPGPTNPTPAQYFIRRNRRPYDTGSVVDYYGFVYHGHNHTHLDALSHVWDQRGGWQGRDPDEFITGEGVTFADVTAWETGIITRGVLLDVPRHRGEPYVTVDRPVHGWELEEVAEAQGVEVRPGDAVLVHSGREAFQADHPDFFFGNREEPTPGLHATCMRYIRDTDVAVLVWDMMDARPNEYELGWAVHPVIYAFGVALVDNALLQPLADACAEEGYEFLLVVAPLRVPGGTGTSRSSRDGPRHGLPFAPDAAIREVDGEAVILVGGGRALLMQIAHPLVAQGVATASGAATASGGCSAPSGRCSPSSSGTPRMCARPRAANAVHRGVLTPRPGAAAWVHATLVDTALQ